MHFSTHLISACLAFCFFLACKVGAQENSLPASAIDPFAAIKDKALHTALSTLASIPPNWGSKPEQKLRDISDIYNQPKNLNAIGVVLAAVQSLNLNEMEQSVRHFLVGTVKAAVISGAKEHVPALLKLAHSSDKDIRDAVASPDDLLLSPSPSFEVLKECLLSAETRLPASLPNSQEASGSLNEFEDRVRVFSEFASDEQRAEIAPIVERFLGRYDNARFKAYYAPRLRKLLQGGSSKLHGLDARKERSSSQGMEPSDTWKKPNTNPTSAPSEEPTSSTPWSTIVVLIVAATGLLWLLLKKRK